MKKVAIVGGIVLVLIVGVAVFFSRNNQTSELVDYESQQESTTSKTKVRTMGLNTEVLVAPSNGNIVSGIVTISITKAPAGTKIALFAINKQGAGDIKTTGPNLGIDSDGNDGWSKIIDTTQYENGLYDISGIAGVDGNSNPLGAATAQVIIQN